ncbi:LAFA_0F21462g1_1 [Lachancea sp. 'fantastica']|nr:LAFA_0F21462g1_1 [Lachancea sp. 'fantastica']
MKTIYRCYSFVDELILTSIANISTYNLVDVLLMNLSTQLRSSLRSPAFVRFYRKRIKPSTSHIPQVKTHQNDLFRPQELKMQAESPEKVEKELKRLGFKTLEETRSSEELFLDYVNSSSSSSFPLKKSQSKLDELGKKAANSIACQDVNVNRMELLFDFILEESEREIERLEKIGPMQMQRLQEKHRTNQHEFEGDRSNPRSEKELEKAVFQDLESASRSESSTSFIPGTERMYRVLSDINMRRLASAGVISTDQMVRAFEAAKTIPLRNIRLRGILLAGHLIYSLEKVRMDPVNESFYIEALVYYGFYKKALELFNSNRQKVNQRWWYEMGMMICLRANHLVQFDKLLNHTLSTFDSKYVAPRILRAAVRKKLYIRDFAGSEKLTGMFIDIAKANGWRSSNMEKKRIDQNVFFANEEQADLFLNKKELPTELDYVALIQYHLFRKRKESGLQLLIQLAMLPKMDIELLTSVILRLKFHLLENFDVLKGDLEPLLTNGTSIALSHLQEAFDRAQQASGIARLPPQYKHILFDSTVLIASYPSLVKNAEDFTNQLLNRESTSEQTSSRREYSLKIHNVLKTLLKDDKESSAWDLLERVEKSFPSEKEASTDNSAANAHHYAVFIDFYSAKAHKTKTGKDIDRYEKKIEEMVARIDEKGIQYNSMLLSSLLQHYRKSGNLDNCFNIINAILNYRASPDTEDQFRHLLSFFKRREITKSLYLEIWRCFSLYYSYFENGLGVTEIRSNHGAWKRNVLRERSKINVHPICDLRFLFKSMVQTDNILPDAFFYQLIIKAFTRVRDWSFLPALLKHMSEVSGIEPDKKSIRFLNGGLRLEYIALEREKLIADGRTDQNSLSSLVNTARRTVENKIKAGTILKESDEKDANQIIGNILDFLEHHRDHELAQVNVALEELDLM